MGDALQALHDAGVSVWLDDLSRTRLVSGNLADLVAREHVRGVTTNL
jgi:transaldolase